MVKSLLALLLLALPSCQRDSAPTPLPPVAVGDGPRRIDIKVSNLGYTPSRVAGRPGERLQLAFHYQASAGECGREVLLPKGATPGRLALVADRPGEARLTLPAKGELQFTCGMNMLRGILLVE